MPLDGHLLQQIHEAFLDCFDEDSIAQLVLFELNKRIEEVTSGANLNIKVFNLIEWARERGQLLKLVEAAAQQRPGIAVLQQLAADLRNTSVTPVDPLGAGHPTAHLKFDWIVIPAGEFLMGSDPTQDPEAAEDEVPMRCVGLPEFRIARVPVTNILYRQFVQAAGYPPPHCWESGHIPDGKEDHPVVNVSWHDAQSFCRWLSEASGTPVRLPTEAEWEKAARFTDGRRYPWGDAPPSHELANFGNAVGDTMPVGSYPNGASAYGVLDMAGNIWEWTNSHRCPHPYQRDERSEGIGGHDGRVIRGGAYALDSSSLRCAHRDFYEPDRKDDCFGFRIAAELR